MKKIFTKSIVFFAVGLAAQQITRAQGTVYLSNLGQGFGGNYIGVGSNSWMTASFQTGTHAGGYALNSIQLGMGNAIGNPSGFTVLIYAASASLNVGSMLGTMSGSTDPATGGIYTYTDEANVMLMPNSFYYIVLTAETPFVRGTAAGSPLGYVWNSGAHYTPSGGWIGADGFGYSSNYGLSWIYGSSIDLQYAINATPIPEPGVLGLFALGGLGFLWQRRRF